VNYLKTEHTNPYQELLINDQTTLLGQ